MFSAYVIIWDIECCCKLPLLKLFDVIHSEIVFLGQIKRLLPKNMCHKVSVNKKYTLQSNVEYMYLIY